MPSGEFNFRPEHQHRRSRPWCLQAILAGVSCLLAIAAAGQRASRLPGDDAAPDEEDLRRYTVELIVFSYTDRASSGSEIFIPDVVDDPVATVEDEEFISDPVGEPVEPFESLPGAVDSAPSKGSLAEDPQEEPIPAFGDFLGDLEPVEDAELVELISGDRIDLHILAPDELSMTAIHEKLVLLDAYRPVLWAGWTQATRPEEETPFIRLRRLGNLPLAFDGQLKLYLSRFLHLVVDITMDEKIPSPAAWGPPVTDARFGRGDAVDFGYPNYGIPIVPAVHYQVLENRIVKSEEIRYFDHPKFGVLAKVSRYELPEEDEVMEEGSEQIVPAAAPARAN